jgi:hypothetical protein
VLSLSRNLAADRARRGSGLTGRSPAFY